MLRFQPMIFLWQPSLRACESEESAASKLDESSLIRPYQVLPVFPIRVLPLRGVGLSSLEGEGNSVLSSFLFSIYF